MIEVALQARLSAAYSRDSLDQILEKIKTMHFSGCATTHGTEKYRGRFAQAAPNTFVVRRISRFPRLELALISASRTRKRIGATRTR